MAAFAGAPTSVFAREGDPVDSYAAARVAEIANRDGEALKIYLKLYRDGASSAVLADRIFDSAIRTGDMASALRSARALELSGPISGEATLLLFADAFARKNWPVALSHAEALSERSNLGFIAPILRNWVNVAQGKAYDLSIADAQAEPLLAYYSSDQRVYFELNAGEYAKAKLSLRDMSWSGGDFGRDLMLRAAPIIHARGDETFADALIVSAIGADRAALGSLPKATKYEKKPTPEEGLSALHVRIATALLEQKINEPALVVARIAVLYAPDSPSAKLVLAKALQVHDLVQIADDILQTIPSTSHYWAFAVRERGARMEAKEALTLARDAAQRWPLSQTLALQLAQAQEKVGDLKGAANSYRKVADSSDTSGSTARQRANYRMLLASVLDSDGDWDGARKELEAALIVDPDNAQVLNYLGYALLDRNQDIGRAKSMIERAFQKAPTSTAIVDSMGWASFKTGDYGQAVVLLEKAAKAAGNDPTINEHLGDAYWQAGRLRDARYAWRTASEVAEGDAASRIDRKIDIGLNRDLPKR